MKRMDLTINGMTCGHCVQRVREALSAVEGVQSCDVELDAGRARVTMNDDVEIGAMSGAVSKAGFQMTGFAPVAGDGVSG
ncbi:MAG TPA: heavy metal-associated domain-containing protein [Phycisphaerae bacterium]|nr:heavy metal-associated domain-containing protein [Phycisphaerae bacterium]HRW55370.1 heavy metal-associated domain-containing protein [Phycisphaerae bacterium]